MRYLILAALLLPSCATAEVGTQRSISEQNAAMDAHLACLRRMAAEYDDGHSSADVIGRTIAPFCRTERLAAAETFGPFRSERARQMTLARIERTAEEIATAVVLENRR